MPSFFLLLTIFLYFGNITLIFLTIFLELKIEFQIVALFMTTRIDGKIETSAKRCIFLEKTVFISYSHAHFLFQLEIVRNIHER